MGRDTLSRLVAGGKMSLIIALIAALSAATIGSVIGLTAGVLGGWVDKVLMRITDMILALPLLPFLIVLAAIDLTKLGFSEELAYGTESRSVTIILVIALFSWPGVARLVRAGTLATMHNTYVTAARALGVPGIMIALRHVLPSVTAPVIVATTLAIGNVILLESTLSFLGLGLQPPTASWGSMLNDAQNSIWDAPMQAVWPGLAISITVVICNLMGDALRDHLDPHIRRKR